VCLNQHHWLASRLHEEGIDFQQCSNAFLRCATPERLQELADTLTLQDLASCGHKWLARFTPFFTETERHQAGCRHRLFFSQVELCDNLIFHRRAALDKLGERLLDANRTIGQPNKITVIFGRKVTRQYRGKLQTEIEDMDLPNPNPRHHRSDKTDSQKSRLMQIWLAGGAVAGAVCKRDRSGGQAGNGAVAQTEATRGRGEEVG
jgi:hypothetical protein